MKASFDCIPCLVKQTIEAARLSSDDKDLQRKILNQVLHYLQSADFEVTPPELGKQIFKIMQEITGCDDPYKDLKLRYNTSAMEKYGELKRFIYLSDDPVYLAAKLALSGNFYHLQAEDFQLTIREYVDSIQRSQFAIDNYFSMLDDLGSTRNILYLADNAGEIVFDKLFIEVLKRFYPERDHQFTVVVRGAPIINDATLEDARLIDLEEVAQVIDNGDNAPATILHLVSEKVRDIYDRADLIISKGQGNFETLHDQKKLIYFMFKVRCPVIAAEINAPEGSLVLKKSDNT